MDENLLAFLRSWPWTPWPVIGCLLTGVVYARGWRILSRRGSPYFGARELTAFLLGLVALLAAIASPLEPFADLLLSVHMAQHLLLMIVAPALLWMGAPQAPLTLGLPTFLLTNGVLPIIQARWWRRVIDYMTHPVVCWLAPAVALWFWHIPRFYELALNSTAWHHAEHATFLASALLFWWPVVQPYPSRARWPRVLLIPYLFLAAMQSTGLCALLTFADRVIYPHYAAGPRLWGLTALDDQALAGSMMWVVGLVALLPPLATISYGLLYDRGTPRSQLQYAGLPRAKFEGADLESPATSERTAIAHLLDSTISSPDAPFPKLVVLNTHAAQPALDLLQTPFLGRLLRSAVARRCAQTLLLVIAGAIVLDGLFGPQIAPMNLAGTLPWIHWRGLVVLTLLVAGNFFCMACPFMLPRAVARRWLSPRHDWPVWLRSKWLAVGLLIGFFWAYEALDLWSTPWWTACIAAGYFIVALVVDSCFRGAAFCKYVCPVGQFQFVQSLVSPLEVRVREPAVCATCRTYDCLRGGPQGRGCETDLFLPQKRGNLDCTFCLDCARACPSGNVGLMATSPLAALTDRSPAGAGHRLITRPDVAALMVLLVFAAFANAAGMVAPVKQWQDQAALKLGFSSTLIESGYLGLALVVTPIVLTLLAAITSRKLTRSRSFSAGGVIGPKPESVGALIALFARALVPLGAAMWLAHYGFHLATGPLAFAPPAERLIADWGGPAIAGATIAHCCCAGDVAPWLLRTEILALDIGLLTSLYVGYQIALRRSETRGQAAATFMPWGILLLLLFALGVWIVFQPMEMRGMMSGGGSG